MSEPLFIGIFKQIMVFFTFLKVYKDNIPVENAT